MMKEKQCCTCKSVLPLSAFHRAGLRKDGRMSRCRDCRAVLYRRGNKSSVLPLDKLHLDETLESILDEMRSDTEKISEAKEKGYETEPRIKDVCAARIEVFKSVLNDLFDKYGLKEKNMKNGTIKRINGEIIIRPVKVKK